MQKTAYEMLISDGSSYVCSYDLCTLPEAECRLGLKPFRRRSLAGLAARPSAEKGAAGIARQYGDRNNDCYRNQHRSAPRGQRVDHGERLAPAENAEIGRAHV